MNQASIAARISQIMSECRVHPIPAKPSDAVRILFLPYGVAIDRKTAARYHGEISFLIESWSDAANNPRSFNFSEGISVAQLEQLLNSRSDALSLLAVGSELGIWDIAVGETIEQTMAMGYHPVEII